VVAAASYAVRRFACVGHAQCAKRCAAARRVCVRSAHGAHKEVSDQVFEIFREFTPLVEGSPWTKHFST